MIADAFSAIERVSIPLLVIALMASVGLRYPMGRLAGVLKAPRRWGLLQLLVVNLVVVPVFAVVGVRMFGLPEPLAVGVILVATCAGGPTGVLYTMNAGGRVDLATGWMLAQLGASAVVAPLAMQMYGGELGTDSLAVFGTIALHQLVPLGLAMGVRRVWPERAPVWSARAAILANGLLGLAVVLLVARRAAFVMGMAADVLFPAVLLVGTATGLGALVSGRGTDSPSDHRSGRHAGALVSGVRNISVALLLAERHFGAGTTAAVLGAGSVSIVVPGVLAWYWGRRGVWDGGPRR